MNDGCKGYSTSTLDGVEHDCEYEYSGYVDCSDCIFGSWGGTTDPRIDPYKEDELEEYEMELDKFQEDVAYSDAQNILVVAGAGSGKTKVLTERVRYLLDKGVEPQNIVCITFTNMASQEMKERLSDVSCIGDAFIGTIHSFANTIYRTSNLEYQILTTELQIEIFRELLGKTILRPCKYENLTFSKYLKYLDLVQLQELGRVSEDEVNTFLLPSEQDDLKLAQAEFEEVCKKRNILNFTQLLEETKKYYESIGGEIEYVLVDEFQDVGNAEADFVFGLNAENLFLVGDDWQSIYGFKGGNVGIFKALLDDPRFYTAYLENNYRNASKIIDFSLKVIDQVKDKIEKNVYTISDLEGSVKVDTKGKVRDYLVKVKESGDFKDWFVLTRSNKEILELEELMDELEIPFRSFKRAGMTFDEMKALMKEDVVKLMTVHVSKGLENKNVILYGNFPVVVPRYMKNEDERKVMYVGITRAEENLVVLN
jgi:DNA helicase-2/ATP-dependent DNA helicase PcrA